MENSQYCKAYLAQSFREYPHWSEKKENVRKEKKEVDGKEVEIDRELTDDSILYLHDSYIVTDGIFKDMNIIFEDVTDEWKEFCHSKLDFEIPVYEPIVIPHAEEQPATGETSETPAAG